MPSLALWRRSFASELLNLREGGALARRKPRKGFRGQGQWLTKKNVLDSGVTRRLYLLLSFPVGVRITHSGTPKGQFASSVAGVQLGRRGEREAPKE